MTELAVIVPTRGRPESVARVAEAWLATGAVGRAQLIWVYDQDDSQADAYRRELKFWPWMRSGEMSQWMPLVPKLNMAARLAAAAFPVVAFMGDDHLPRSKDWDLAITGYAAATEPAIIYGRDGYKDEKLPTWWAMSASIVEALDRMVPADVQHMYCDNSIRALGEATGTLHYLPHVFIEHMHPAADKAKWDEGYRRVNRRQQYIRDQALYRTWLNEGLDRDAKILLRLRNR